LANVLTEADKKILLIDADFRQSSVQNELGLSNGEGLSDVLKGNTKLTNVIKYYENNKNYQVITAGTSLEYPSEYLSSDKLKKLLEEERNNFDYIIINGHPIDEITDTVVLSTLTDGVLLYIKKNKTKMKEILKIKNMLSELEVKL